MSRRSDAPLSDSWRNHSAWIGVSRRVQERAPAGLKHSHSGIRGKKRTLYLNVDILFLPLSYASSLHPNLRHHHGAAHRQTHTMATTSTILVISSLAIAFTTWLYLRLIPVPLPDGIPYYPTSTSRPFGDGPTIKSTGRLTREPSAALFALCRQLGSPIVQFLLTSLPGTTPTLVLDDPREVEDILLRRNREFDRSYLTVHLFQQILPAATLAQVTTPKLKAQKRLWSDVMHPDFLRRVVAPNLQTAGVELVELWKARMEKLEDGEGAFEVLNDFYSTALDAIWVAVLGKKIGVLRHEIAKVRGEGETDGETAKLVELVRFAVEEGSTIMNAGVGSLWPALTFFLMSFKPSYRRFRSVGTEEVGKIMRAACERFHRLSDAGESSAGDGEEHDTCAMDFVLRREIMTAKKEGKPAPDPTRNPAMLDELWLMLLAGHDSTASTLAWLVKFMGLHPRAQANLRQAVLAAFEGTKFPTSSEILEVDIPLLDATIEETVRCSATAAITTRRALVDTQVLGRHIPKGTNVILNLRIDRQPFEIEESQRSETCRAAQTKRPRGGIEGPSGRDLDLFEPRRWLTHDATTGKEVFDAYALPNLTFGGGFRGCFGKRLAMLELRIIVTTLMLNFEFIPLPAEMAGLEAEEEVFRKPKTAFVKLRVL